MYSSNYLCSFVLFQLLTQALNRITASSNLFDNVTRLHLPGLETVDRFPVLGAVAGILVTLLLHGTSERYESELLPYQHCINSSNETEESVHMWPCNLRNHISFAFFQKVTLF
jgi:hypothetical protein